MKSQDASQPDAAGAGFLSPVQVHAFRRKLMHWYRLHARELPWRLVRNPYRTWLSEVMLQQTRVAAVLEHYERFLRLFPTVVALALAPEADVLAAWSGLGYYRRARMLHKAAQFLVRERGGRIPEHAAELKTLPGIGDYTCAAIASIAFGESIAVVDGNVERVLLRITGRAEEGTAAARRFVCDQAAALVPHKRLGDHTNAAGDHNQAMMELGATICLPRAPLCLHCPVSDLCITRGEHITLPRGRQRSQPAAFLLATRQVDHSTEVLLERRSDECSRMPGMLELPPLPMDAVEGREPLLRLRHAITNTNYYVEIHAERGPRDHALRRAVPAPEDVLCWTPVAQLARLPLTGLARKVLQRVDLSAVAGRDLPPQRTESHRSNQALPFTARILGCTPLAKNLNEPAPDRPHLMKCTEIEETNMDRSASAVWHGGLKDGHGTISTQSGVLKESQYSFKTRFENGIGTNPEELIAAAHAGCFTMAFGNELATSSLPAESIETTAVVTMTMPDNVPTVSKIHLTTKARVPGATEEKFQELARKAKETCPISRLLKAAEITMDATLLA